MQKTVEKSVTCPDCGRPLKKSGRKIKYFCENNSCAVIYVQYPGRPPLTRVVRKADACPPPHTAVQLIVDEDLQKQSSSR